MRCTKRITSWLWTTSSPSFSASRKSKKQPKRRYCSYSILAPDTHWVGFAKRIRIDWKTTRASRFVPRSNPSWRLLLIKKKKKLATYSIRTVIRVDHVWLGVVVTRIWNYKRSREGFSLLKVSLVCRGAKSVVDWSVVGRRNPEKRNNSIQFNSSYWRANFLCKCKLFKYSSCHKE